MMISVTNNLDSEYGGRTNKIELTSLRFTPIHFAPFQLISAHLSSSHFIMF